jgi:hypothetical protein
MKFARTIVSVPHTIKGIETVKQPTHLRDLLTKMI